MPPDTLNELSGLVEHEQMVRGRVERISDENHDLEHVIAELQAEASRLRDILRRHRGCPTWASANKGIGEPNGHGFVGAQVSCHHGRRLAVER